MRGALQALVLTIVALAGVDRLALCLLATLVLVALAVGAARDG